MPGELPRVDPVELDPQRAAIWQLDRNGGVPSGPNALDAPERRPGRAASVLVAFEGIKLFDDRERNDDVRARIGMHDRRIGDQSRGVQHDLGASPDLGRGGDGHGLTSVGDGSKRLPP